MKAIGFLKQCMGDLVNQTVPLRAFKQVYPDSHFVFGIDQKYKSIEPLFKNHPWISETHIWDGIDNNWPNNEDNKYIQEQKFDLVFNAMADHTRPDWFNFYHYGAEFSMMAGLVPPTDLSPYLNRWFDLYDNCNKVITLSMFPSFDQGQKKSLSIDKLEDLCINIKKLGYSPIQIGSTFERKLENAERPELTILQAAQLLCSSKLHLTADCFYAWLSSAYRRPTIGVYTNNLPTMTNSWSHRPINPEAFYFHRNNLLDLTSEEIIDKIKEFSI